MLCWWLIGLRDMKNIWVGFEVRTPTRIYSLPRDLDAYRSVSQNRKETHIELKSAHHEPLVCVP